MAEKQRRPSLWESFWRFLESNPLGNIIGVILVVACIALIARYCYPVLHVKSCYEIVMDKCYKDCPWCTRTDCEAEAAFECIEP